MLLKLIVLAIMLLCALWTVMTRGLVRAALGLAATSIALTVLMFMLGAGLAAVFELSVCAGLITVARATVEGMPPTLGLLDIVARRNAFGRQVRSFEADLEVQGVAGAPVHAVFIRAPWVESAGPGVEVLARFEGHIVAARGDDVLVTAFHPELTDDARLHELFIEMIRRGQSAAAEPGGAAKPRAFGEPGRAATAGANR